MAKADKKCSVPLSGPEQEQLPPLVTLYEVDFLKVINEANTCLWL